MALFGSNKRVERLERELANLRELVPTEVLQGQTVDSPFVQSQARSLVPWRRREITEAATATVHQKAPARQGFLADIPIGGATEWNQGYTQIGGATDRRTLMEQLQQLYKNCPWASACVDTIARFCTAGGMSIEPDDESDQRKEKIVLSAQAQKAQALFDYVNPQQNFRQLMRTIFTDLLIYGDSFIEVVWALGEPIALYGLPCPDMLIDADEHGEVNFYVQRTETNRRAQFDPHQVIHIKFDSPRGGLYGLGPTEKAVHPIVTWVATEGLVKKTMERGDPPNVAFMWDINLAENQIKKFSQQYVAKNLGAQNVGNPIDLIGETGLHEFTQNKLADYDAIKDKSRDEVLGTYGVPPAIVSIIESGNLGGGTGTSQFKTFRVNTCGPVQELVLEAFTFAILEQGFGVTDHRCTFGEIDWRDDAVIEEIRAKRVERGGWTINRYRDDIGEPPVVGGDDPVIIQTRDVVLVKDLAEMSKAQIDKNEGMAATVPGVPVVPDDSNTIKPPGASTDTSDNQPPAHAKGSPTESADDRAFAEAWNADLRARQTQALRELPKAEHDG